LVKATSEKWYAVYMRSFCRLIVFHSPLFNSFASMLAV